MKSLAQHKTACREYNFYKPGLLLIAVKQEKKNKEVHVLRQFPWQAIQEAYMD